MKNPIGAGFIAGAIAGIIPFVQNYVYIAIGWWMWEPYDFPLTIAFLISHAIDHVGFNAIWGAIFGVFFALFFDRIPGKGINKGLVIALIYYLFVDVQPAYFYWVYDNPIWAGFFIMGFYFIDKIIYGIIFVALYKK